jgi:hypothetical protein
METRSDFVVFVDESGDHNLQSINPRYPVFVLAFCILPVESYLREVGTDFRRLKFELFGHDVVVLHEHDIRKRSGPYASLDSISRERLLHGLTTIIEDATMTIVAVVIDKPRLLQSANGQAHPYNLALRYGLERVHHFLQMNGQGSLRTTVVCEARGNKEDRDLRRAFEEVRLGRNRGGYEYPFDLVVADKRTNSEGLQLADLVARPIGLHVLRPDQFNRAWLSLARKLFDADHRAWPPVGLKVVPPQKVEGPLSCLRSPTPVGNARPICDDSGSMQSSGR